MSTGPDAAGTWHVDPDLLDSYADGGALSPSLLASVEAHVERCGACRQRLAPAVDPQRLDAVWAEVVDTLDRPPVSAVERLLVVRSGPQAACLLLVLLTGAVLVVRPRRSPFLFGSLS